MRNLKVQTFSLSLEYPYKK